MHVVHPYPTMLKPSSARVSRRPAALSYSVTMSEPGARLVLTHGLVLSPRFTAFLARRPAPIITLGFDVLVQLVIAATTTDPCVSPSTWRNRRRGGDRRGRRSTRARCRRDDLRLALGQHYLERLLESELRLAKRHAILRALRSGKAGLDSGQVELHRRGVDRIARALGSEQPLFLAVPPRPIGPALRRGRSAVSSRASCRQSGKSRWSRRIRATCCQASRSRRWSGFRGRDRRTRRTFPPLPACAAAR